MRCAARNPGRRGDSASRENLWSLPVSRFLFSRQPVALAERLLDVLLAYDFLFRHQLPEILESHQKLAILLDCFERIHSAQTRAAEPAAIRRVDGHVARANKFLL